jgi:hypothetical protein
MMNGTDFHQVVCEVSCAIKAGVSEFDLRM